MQDGDVSAEHTDQIGTPPAPRRFRARRRLIAIAGGAVLALVGIAVAVLTVPLPVSLVAPRIMQAIGNRLGPNYHVSIGRARIDHNGAAIGFRLDGFAIRDPAGNTVLNVPEAVVGLNNDFLIGQSVSATSIRLVAPHITLRIDKSGEVSLAAAEGAPPLFRLTGDTLPRGAPARLVGILAAADATLGKGGLFADLRRVDIERASIVIDDRRRGRIDRLEGIDLRFARPPHGPGLTLSATSSDPDDHWSATATLNGAPGSGRDLDVGFRGFSLARLSFEALHGHSPVAVDGIASGHLYLRIGRDGSIPTAEARLDLSNLRVAPTDHPEGAVAFDAARAELHWDAAAHRIVLDTAELRSGAGHARFTGSATPVAGQADAWTYAVDGGDILIPAAGPETVAVPIAQLHLDGRFDAAASSLTVARATVQGPLISAAGRAAVHFGGSKPHATLSLAAGRTPLAAVMRLWPATVMPHGRAWFADHVADATVDSLSIAVDEPLQHVTGPNRTSVSLNARFEGASAKLLSGVPPLTAVTGTLTVQGRVLTVNADSGQLVLGAGNANLIGITGGHLTLPDITVHPTRADLVLNGTGPLGAFGTLLRAAPLAHVLPATFDLRRGTGTVTASVEVSGSMGHDAPPGQLRTTVKASIADGALEGTVAGHHLSHADLAIALGRDTATVRGRLDIDRAQVSVDARAARGQHGEIGQTVVAASLNPAKLRGRGLADAVSGPIAVRLSLPRLDTLAGAKLEADLTSATVALPGGVSKPAGRAAQAAFVMQPEEDGWELDDFALDAKPIVLHGTVRLDAHGDFVGATLPTFRISAGDDLAAEIDRSGGGYRVALHGGAIDARRFLHRILGNGGPGADGADLVLTARLGTAVGYDGEAIAGLDLALAREDGRLSQFDLRGRLGGATVLAGSDGTGQITVRAGNGGAALRFLGIYRRARGGVLTAALVPGRSATRGEVTMRDFGIAGESALDPVLSGNAAKGTVSFTRMHAAFRLADGRATIDDAAIWGPEVGATLDGAIDYARSRVDVRGTFVPAYLVNNLFSKLPIIGTILGGGPHEGLLGVTFQVAGPLSDPTLRVNPMSAVAPGFLRNLFAFAAPSASDPDGIEPAAPPHRSSLSDGTKPLTRPLPLVGPAATAPRTVPTPLPRP